MISFADNIAEFERGLSDLAQNQLPFAVALALNDTAQDVDRAWITHLRRRLDRPTPFTMRGVRRGRASKTRLTAFVAFKDVQARYLARLQKGGTRRPAGRALLVPVRQRLNKYGNMPRGSLVRSLAKKGVFAGKVNGKGGVYQRPTKRQAKAGIGPKLLVSFQPRAEYRKTLNLQRAAQGAARSGFPRHFAKRFKEALRTAK